MDFDILYNTYKEKTIKGRYIIPKMILPLLEVWDIENHIKIEGYSVQNRPIYTCNIGSGETRIFIWSQMHGSESTTTKALFDFLNFLRLDTSLAIEIKKIFTFCIIPIVNPDGAIAYTRNNANNVDLNRDAQILSQPESKILRAVFEIFKPHYCFNLHDQRTIFAAGKGNHPATVSFLSPAYDNQRSINEVRLKAMDIIVSMNHVLQTYIPQQVGRFDDSFNIDCIGDTFQSLGVPTILFEAGHFQNDYDREITRKYLFFSLISAILHLKNKNINDKCLILYNGIPKNSINFYDIKYKNIKFNNNNSEKIIDLGIQFNEVLVDDKIKLHAYIKAIGDLEEFYGHFEYDFKEALYTDNYNNYPEIDKKANFCLNNDIKIINGLLDI